MFCLQMWGALLSGSTWKYADGLQAVNGLQRREIFEGNTTEAAFYLKEKFEAQVFE